MACSFGRRSKHRDIKDLLKPSIAFWGLCERSGASCGKPEVPHAPLQDFSAHEAVWLFARDPDSLDEEEQATLTAIGQASETARLTYQLVQEFRHMLHHREGAKLDTWLALTRLLPGVKMFSCASARAG